MLRCGHVIDLDKVRTISSEYPGENLMTSNYKKRISNVMNYLYTLLPYPTLKEYRKYELLHRPPNNLPCNLRGRRVLGDTPSLRFALLFCSHPLPLDGHSLCNFHRVTRLTPSLDFKSTVPSFQVLPISASKIGPTPEIPQGQTIVSPVSFKFFTLVKPTHVNRTNVSSTIVLDFELTPVNFSSRHVFLGAT